MRRWLRSQQRGQLRAPYRRMVARNFQRGCSEVREVHKRDGLAPSSPLLRTAGASNYPPLEQGERKAGQREEAGWPVVPNPSMVRNEELAGGMNLKPYGN